MTDSMGSPIRAWMCTALEQAINNSYEDSVADIFPELYDIPHTYMTEYGCTSAWASVTINGEVFDLEQKNYDFPTYVTGRENRIKVLQYLKTILK